MDRLVCALCETEEQADAAVSNLVESGLDKDVVSVLLHKGHYAHEDVEVSGTKARGRLLQGAAIGGLAGAALGGLIFGPIGLIGVGPLAAAVFGASSGTVYGAVAGALTGRDADKDVIRDLAKQVENGRILVTVDVEGRANADEVEEILRHAGSSDVRTV